MPDVTLPTLVFRRGDVEADPWTFIGLDGIDPLAPLPDGPVAVPLSQWRLQRASLCARHGRVGVWLAPDDDPQLLADDFGLLTLVAIRFPKFTDGRGYSTAVVVRRNGYKGELRAFGDIGLDQVFYLSRCGFDAFSLKPGLDPGDAARHLRDFGNTYQAAVDNPLPLFRRRQLARGAA
ncbi:DUF934 domain-containing protein [Usitatibacter palustris]|uniref:Oxidoreductase n=1 Tax=Usitatibacter palustris TaxID=2732487 RepID=A0A6M4H8S2_9PROT|nr:DUF934 domain-containing protein [Usitatibacter palustris]QJR15595.1 hypothetical protein DSM104440_02417 [Usitatibacter palustris]